MRVLVVDDNDGMLRVLQLMLKGLEVTADLASNGKEAVELVRDGNYDLVLMDVMMPIMDGIQAARQMRGLCGDRLRIVGMSADVDEQGQEDAVRAGMNSLDRKPTSYADLERLLRPKAPI